MTALVPCDLRAPPAGEVLGHELELWSVYLYRGRRADPTEDRARTETAIGHAAEIGEAVLRVWYPPPQVVFGRLDRHAEGYDQARAWAREQGFPPAERSVGGRAVVMTGTTLAFVRAEPVAEPRAGIDDRYETVLDTLTAVLNEFGVDVSTGEPPESFCPGSYGLQADGKLAGLAQRVRQDVAVVGGVLIVDDRDRVATILGEVYRTLDYPFDPQTVGSVTAVAGQVDPDDVRTAVETALSGPEPAVRYVD